MKTLPGKFILENDTPFSILITCEKTLSLQNRQIKPIKQTNFFILYYFYLYIGNEMYLLLLYVHIFFFYLVAI